MLCPLSGYTQFLSLAEPCHIYYCTPKYVLSIPAKECIIYSKVCIIYSRFSIHQVNRFQVLNTSSEHWCIQVLNTSSEHWCTSVFTWCIENSEPQWWMWARVLFRKPPKFISPRLKFMAWLRLRLLIGGFWTPRFSFDFSVYHAYCPN
jgi:hypothetical protein